MNHALIQAARAARTMAQARYSHFRVGAALLTKSGKIFTGCNVESSSFGLTICAERVALFKALSEGETEFEKIAITSDASRLCPPCGACRQVLWDYAKNISVILVNDENQFEEFSLAQLLPEAFEENFLQHPEKNKL
jgi:cytidine deaminase